MLQAAETSEIQVTLSLSLGGQRRLELTASFGFTPGLNNDTGSVSLYQQLAVMCCVGAVVFVSVLSTSTWPGRKMYVGCRLVSA